MTSSQYTTIGATGLPDHQASQIYDAIQTRPIPEVVARLVKEILAERLTATERLTLEVATRRPFWHSSMPSDFARPTTAIGRQLVAATALFGTGPSLADTPSPVDVYDAVSLVRIAAAEAGISTKLTKRERRALGIFKNARWYNKRRRLISALDRKAARFDRASKIYVYTRASKSGLAIDLTRARLAADANTACFVAYYSARRSRRSVFTNTAQERAYDDVSEMLLRRCLASASTDWEAIAHVFIDERVIEKLSDEERGRLIGRAWGMLSEIADFLSTIASTLDARYLSTMIVGRGQDSTTWNKVAGAWNIVRSNWIALVAAVGATSVTNAVCPGKVMRLMAADVASWHGELHEDTRVWARLPFPWDVTKGTATCGLADIEAACKAEGVSVASWTGVSKRHVPVGFVPTPELVHGVVVTSPSLAAILRKAGVFSGDTVKGDIPDFDVVRDGDGFALRVDS